MPRVLVPLADGFEEMEGIIIIDVLRRAGVEVVAAGLHAGPIVASRGTQHVPDRQIDEVFEEDFDMIVLPGGAEGAQNLEKNSFIKKILDRMIEGDKPVAAICAAPNVLRNHGYLGSDVEFTMHPGQVVNGKGGVYVTDRRIVHSGRFTTSLGPGSAFEFALDLVEQLVDAATREKVASPMMLPASVAAGR